MPIDQHGQKPVAAAPKPAPPRAVGWVRIERGGGRDGTGEPEAVSDSGMTLDIILLVASFAIIIAGAELFTNGVEWLGVRLNLSEGTVGSVLAAVGTALPETMIPIVALLAFEGGASEEIGLGAILGAPFMLATVAFFVTALAAFVYRERREAGALLTVDRRILSRDLGFFLPLYGAAIGVSFAPIGHWVRWLVAVGLIVAYAVYVYLNLRETAEGEKEEPLTLNLFWALLPLLRPVPDREARRARRQALNGRPPRLRAVSGQVMLALGLIIGGAVVFVDATRAICEGLGFSPLVIALVVAPIATELPEKFNSVIWIRQSKDTLSLGNITGAMVFQSTFPVTLGILLTDWHFGSLDAGDCAMLSAAIALFSGVLVLITVRRGRGRTMAPWALAIGLLWWLAFIGYVVHVTVTRGL
jgi:cation:H+ antiporter